MGAAAVREGGGAEGVRGGSEGAELAQHPPHAGARDEEVRMPGKEGKTDGRGIHMLPEPTEQEEGVGPGVAAADDDDDDDDWTFGWVWGEHGSEWK